MQGRSTTSPASALSPWGSHFYPALSASSSAKWAQEESLLWETGRPYKEANRRRSEVGLAATRSAHLSFATAACELIPMAPCGGRQSIWSHFIDRVMEAR